jgi:hypothetical protein
MVVFDDWNGPALYVGGAFDSAGGQPASSLAVWDGANWRVAGMLCGTLQPRVRALAPFDDGAQPALFVGGSFVSVDGVASLNIAKFACPLARADMNGDGAINLFDVDGFVLALLDPDRYDQEYPDADVMLADANADGRVDNFDIDNFVVRLLGNP